MLGLSFLEQSPSFLQDFCLQVPFKHICPCWQCKWELHFPPFSITQDPLWHFSLLGLGALWRHCLKLVHCRSVETKFNSRFHTYATKLYRAASFFKGTLYLGISFVWGHTLTFWDNPCPVYNWAFCNLLFDIDNPHCTDHLLHIWLESHIYFVYKPEFLCNLYLWNISQMNSMKIFCPFDKSIVWDNPSRSNMVTWGMPWN